MFRISIFEFRIFLGFAVSPRIDKTYPGPPIEMAV